MKQILFIFIAFLLLTSETCENEKLHNQTAKQEQINVEANQSRLNSVQPAPRVEWSLERDNLIKRFKLMNDRSVVMFMYVFPLGSIEPIGYYQVNKVSSVNSQLTNPSQIVDNDGGNLITERYREHVLPSPAEDGSYGTNGDAIFGFTPEDIYIEHNMQYICSTAPLNFSKNPQNLGSIDIETLTSLKTLMKKLEQE